MKITIFAKKRTTREGKPFIIYLSKLKRKDGSELPVTVKFQEECGAPKKEICPVIIEVDKNAANLSKHIYVREDTGEEIEKSTLWVSDWRKTEEKFVDHSLDDFE